jgi:condensin complex subunit 1
MAKMMLVSQAYAKEHIRRFFTLLCKSPHACVRVNMVVAAGDLCFRWPNLVEPYSRELYESLNDHMKCENATRRRADQCVRHTCLLVLTHLLLNDMIKPKEYVSEVALATLDERVEMAALAKQFFVDMSTKGDQLYNLLPDVIR